MAETQLTCRYCGAQFNKPTGRGAPPKTCSPECRSPDGQRLGRFSRGIRSPRGQRKVKAKIKVCEGCCASEVKLVKGLCAECHKAGRLISRAIAVRRRNNRAHLPPDLGGEQASISGVCLECGAGFDYVPHKGAKAKRYCTSQCQGRASDRVRSRWRRAVTRGVGAEKVDYNVVFARDGWRCQLCGRKTDVKARGKMRPKSPVIDHIIPLAAGGSHSYLNVQCACHACNSAKGVTEKGQMLLFGTL
jgi:5-methylcytosine-specific restriction endonuclease McrA